MRPRLLFFLLLAISLAGWSQVLPKPRVASAEGTLAPGFTLQDQNGKTVRLSSLKGQPVLLVFFRGTWWPYCTGQLREFAQHSKQFDDLKLHVLCISNDDPKKMRDLWNQVLGRKFTVLTDPDARVIREYGILDEGEDIALDTTLFVGPDGRERWRHVSATLPDLLTAEQTLKRVRQSLSDKPKQAK